MQSCMVCGGLPRKNPDAPVGNNLLKRVGILVQRLHHQVGLLVVVECYHQRLSLTITGIARIIPFEQCAKCLHFYIKKGG